jgi:hypothetical protein
MCWGITWRTPRNFGPSGDRSENYFVNIVKGTLLRGIALSEPTELASGFATTMAVIGKRGMAATE